MINWESFVTGFALGSIATMLGWYARGLSLRNYIARRDRLALPDERLGWWWNRRRPRWRSKL